jgi:quinol monooxygenase YgiN
MIAEYIRYKVTDADALVRAYGLAAESLRASAHCLGFELSRCAEAPNEFILRIEWDSADGHMKGFRGSPEFKVFLGAIQPFIKDIQEMRHYELTDVRWSRS